MITEPLKVTFTFLSPVVMDSEYPIYLDALLAFAVVQEAEEKHAVNAWSHGEELPLEKAGEGQDWVFKASRLVFTPAAHRELVNMQRRSSPETFYRDFDLGLWGYPGSSKAKTPPVINTMSGQFRAYQYYVSTQWMEKACAWCVGDRERIMELLARLTHIGKMGRNGWGLLESVTVEVDEEAKTKWALRVLPKSLDVAQSGVTYASVMSPPRAPYWNKVARVEMLEPVL